MTFGGSYIQHGTLHTLTVCTGFATTLAQVAEVHFPTTCLFLPEMADHFLLTLGFLRRWGSVVAVVRFLVFLVFVSRGGGRGADDLRHPGLGQLHDQVQQVADTFARDGRRRYHGDVVPGVGVFVIQRGIEMLLGQLSDDLSCQTIKLRLDINTLLPQELSKRRCRCDLVRGAVAVTWFDNINFQP